VDKGGRIQVLQTIGQGNGQPPKLQNKTTIAKLNGLALSTHRQLKQRRCFKFGIYE
jgi:hypothetical protein